MNLGNYYYYKLNSGVPQNLKGIFATSKYSVFENLYLRVDKNLGLTSYANDFRSSVTSFRSSSLYPVFFSISLFQALILFIAFADRISAAAANSEVLYFSRDASNSAISQRY